MSHCPLDVRSEASGQFTNAYVITAQPNTGSTSDTTPPIASNIQATNITQTGATITWTTNEPADSNVDYGLTSSYGSSSGIDPTLKTSHSMTLSSLTAGTLYHYRVTSKDAAGNLTSSADFTFTTQSAPAPTCTAITGFASNCIGTTPVFTAQKTNQTATTLSLGITVSLPSSPINAIYNTGYWFSPAQNKWVPFTLSGTPYPNSTSFFTNNASANLALPLNELGSSPAYIVVWDYAWNGSAWTGPACVGGSPQGSPGCWRLVTVPTR